MNTHGGFYMKFYSEFSNQEKENTHQMLRVKNFTLDGLSTDVMTLLELNDFHESELQEILNLPINKELYLGGGAAATFILKRVS